MITQVPVWSGLQRGCLGAVRVWSEKTAPSRSQEKLPEVMFELMAKPWADWWRDVFLMCCLSQGTLAVLALQLARQIHFQASLPAGPRRAKRGSWRSPLDCFLSSPLWRPSPCEFSVLGIGGLGWEFVWVRKYLWTHLRKRAISSSLPFLSEVRGRGMWGSSIHAGCGPHLPSNALPCPPITFHEGSPTGVQDTLDLAYPSAS